MRLGAERPPPVAMYSCTAERGFKRQLAVAGLLAVFTYLSKADGIRSPTPGVRANNEAARGLKPLQSSREGVIRRAIRAAFSGFGTVHIVRVG